MRDLLEHIFEECGFYERERFRRRLQRVIIWLASYPRSGNTLLRTILLRCFGLNTHSLYDDEADIGAQPEFSSIVGHLSHGLEKQSFYKKAIVSDQTYFIKTHDPPLDDAKAIYIVRDGRSSIVSYFHYIGSFSAKAIISLRDVVVGDCMFGSWSDHLESWIPVSRPNTLLLRYEDLVYRPHQAIQMVSDFIGYPVVRWDHLPSFADLKAVNAKFFRKGNDADNIGELEGEDLDLFWLMHGELMIKLNYVDAMPSLNHAARVGGELRHRLVEARNQLGDARREEKRLKFGRQRLKQKSHLSLSGLISRLRRIG